MRVEADPRGWSFEDWGLIFRLLLTSTSLEKLRLIIKYEDDRLMSALAQYLGAASRVSLKEITLYIYGRSFSIADFVSLCDSVAGSQLRKLTLDATAFDDAYLYTATESLARAISTSSLEEVTVRTSWLNHMALFHTLPVRNLDFAISAIGTVLHSTRMTINRKWKPLLTANTVPLALWPRILEKAHASPETSHGPVGILFYILREKPDLVQ